MWARVAELMLGLWLMMSPFIFRGTDRIEAFLWLDLAAGATIVVLSLLSFGRRTAWAHLATGLFAIALAAFAYVRWPPPGPPAAQNEIAVAMTLLLLSIVPNEANQPPRPWRGVGR